ETKQSIEQANQKRMRKLRTPFERDPGCQHSL
ncbi:MAG: hypothetical protein ACI9SC_002714, partial [Gammaproteobacteria bacterium]